MRYHSILRFWQFGFSSPLRSSENSLMRLAVSQKIWKKKAVGEMLLYVLFKHKL